MNTDTAKIEQWFHNWMKSKGKEGTEAATVNVLDMLKDFAADQPTPVQKNNFCLNCEAPSNGKMFCCKECEDIYAPVVQEGQGEGKIVFDKADWEAFKLRMGDRNYQGLINIEDFVSIIWELEDKSKK